MEWMISTGKIFLPGMILSILALLGNPTSVFRDINFSDAKYDAAAESKHILLYFYSEWCEPCTWMEKNCLSKPAVQSMLDKNFIPLKVDLDELEGFEMRRKYEIRIMPTIIILDENGKVMHRAEETMNVKKMLAFIETVTQASDPENQHMTVHQTNTSPIDHVYRIKVDNQPHSNADSSPDIDENTHDNKVIKRNYYLQFGLFTSKDAAIRKKRQLYMMHGIHTNIHTTKDHKYRLIGFASDAEDELYDTKQKLSTDYSIDCFVVCL